MSRKKPAVTRRAALKIIGAAPLLAAIPSFAALGLTETHGLLVFGDLKYPAGFKNFDYVNPAAPVGGIFSHVPGEAALNQNFNTFNTMNTFILRGDAPLQMEMTFAGLMARALDEPDALYGLAAERVRHDDKKKYFQFVLRKAARFHDGSPLTADDVAFSIETLKKDGHPLIAATLSHVQEVKAEAPDIVGIRLSESAPRDVILTVAGLPIFSKAYYGKVDFKDVTMEPPLGSGAFKVGRFEQGRFIEYERVSDWWGWQVPAMRGSYNWSKIRIEYYRDRDVAFEGFKAGEYLFREEFTARVWANAYDFPALKEGRVKKAVLPDGRISGMQGFFINLRRDKFKDARIRQALALAFDFEWSNKNLFFGQYKRTQSIFENSPLKAEGAPSAEELALLEPFRSELPKEAFGEPLLQPVSDGSGSDRVLLRRAAELLRDAGIKMQNGAALLPSGEKFMIEFLEFDSTFERIALPYIKNLQALGIDARLRVIDPAQYQSRSNNYDFDITNRRFSLEPTPGESMRRLLSSRDADTPGSYNLAGVKNPAVDALLEHIINAPDRKALTIACCALDRVLRSLHFWVPQWYKGTHNIAYWDVYRAPPVKPLYARGVVETWWLDKGKAQQLGKGI